MILPLVITICLKSSYSFYIVIDYIKLHYMTLDDDSELGAHVRSNLWYLICFRHLIKNESRHKSDFFDKKKYFPSYVRNIYWITIQYKYHPLSAAFLHCPYEPWLMAGIRYWLCSHWLCSIHLVIQVQLSLNKINNQWSVSTERTNYNINKRWTKFFP